MKRDQFPCFQSWYTEYVSHFYSQEHDQERQWAIRLKDEHSRRVREEVIVISHGLDLPEQDIALAEVLGLFHDIGRFYQYQKYGTFRDDLSENHAELGVKEISHAPILSTLSYEEKEIIKKGILYHNLHKLPEDEKSRCLFFCKLLRDADKLDIWKVVIHYYQNEQDHNPHVALELGLPDTPGCSQEILDDLHSGQTSSAGSVKNLNDYKLLQIGWVYDINFSPTFHEIKNREYLQKIARRLPETVESKEVLATAEKYVALHAT
jgi:HD superfamily phosphohydrolase YqeK